MSTCPDCKGIGTVLIDTTAVKGGGVAEEHGPCGACGGSGNISCKVCNDNHVLFEQIVGTYTYENSDGEMDWDYEYELCPVCNSIGDS